MAEDVHRFAVVWSPRAVEWLVEDQPSHRLTRVDVPGPSPFEHAFFLLLDLAVGGAWPGNADVEPVLPATMLVTRVEISSSELRSPADAVRA